MSYKKKMQQRYKLSDDQYETHKKDAQKQLKNWEEFRKEQVVEIFHTQSQYVSKSKNSDVRHPKMQRANTVVNRQGVKVDVEFGRLKEYYLSTLAPQKKFVSIRDHAAREKELDALRKKQKISLEQRKDKQDNIKKSQAEYDQMKSLYAAPVDPKQTKVETMEQKEVLEPTAPMEKFVVNTTDDKRALFPASWYQQPISRSQLKKGKMIYWMAKDEEEDMTLDDDPEGKYTVTAEKLIETMTAGGKVKHAGITEPPSNTANTIMSESLASINARYKKSCERNAVFMNTLHGTIEFNKKQVSVDKTLSTSSISQDDATDAPNQIIFAPTITSHVFKGRSLKRQYAVKNKALETFEEDRKDYTREAGEETSGL
ncbi:Pre-mRNA-splicing factor SYF2 [Caenorhabditis elegans]|nr:Pre-mRNA-splicing factor SYF2 [Caenorhabditis elegans]CTQ86337.1 Pre-mRNA-splicing factor SYF2 [Caenorhabditis elegans]|eukprot:NP_001300398.1 Uncharacterized protein CELE_K07A12.5 [Caenorhabditis elegans]